MEEEVEKKSMESKETKKKKSVEALVNIYTSFN